MKPLSFFHCAEPRLGTADGRGDDRLIAFEQLIADALAAEVSLVLVAGRLFAPGAPEPRVLGRLCDALTRLRKGGASAWTTCEDSDRGWLGYLVEQQLLEVLAVRPEAATELPSAVPAAGLQIVGLGRPADGADLQARCRRLPRTSAETAVVAIVHDVVGFTRTDLATATDRAAYVALGGGPTARKVGTARDPGPLARLALSDDGVPGYLKVGWRGAKATVRSQPSSDRPLIAVGLRLTKRSTAASVEKDLRKAIAESPVAVPSGVRPLLRIDLTGPPSNDIDDPTLIAIGQRLSNPVLCRIHRPDAPTPGRQSRVEVERAVLEQLAQGADPSVLDLATTVLSEIDAPDGVARAIAAIAHHVGCSVEELGLTPGDGTVQP